MDESITVNHAKLNVVEEKISTQRLASFLESAGGDRHLALKIYEWNNEFSAALWQLISLLEVAVRNSIDRKMCERQVRLERAEHWIFDDSHELGRNRFDEESHLQPYKDIDRAIKQVQKNGKQLTPSQIISETPFGFWNQLIGKRNQFLWPDLAGAFPYAPSRDQKYISTLFSDLRDIRNRISHHHKLHSPTIETGELMILELAKALHPEYADWLTGQSRISEVLSKKP
jgi:hypothetical protein